MAAAGNDLMTLGVVAAGPVIAYRGVGFDNLQAGALGQKIKGVAVHRAAAGEAVGIVVVGTAMVEAGAAIVGGDSLIVDAQGRAVPAAALTLAAGAVAVTSSAATGPLVGAEPPDYIFADALQDAAAAGDIIEVLMRR